MSYNDQIQALQTEIEAKMQQLNALKQQGKSEALATIRKLISDHGLTAGDLGDILPPAARKRGPAAGGGKAKTAAGRPMKYFDPVSQKGWSGSDRGKIPEPFHSIVKAHNNNRDAAKPDLAKYLVQS